MWYLYAAFKFLRRFGASRLFWLGGPILLYVWAVPGPFVFDDLNLLNKVEAYDAGERERLDLFSFAPTQADWQRMRSRGTYPWWSPAERRIDFKRPIAQWSFWLDVQVFGRNPIGPRIESLVLFAIVLVVANQLYRSAEPDLTRAGIATFFLGVSQCLTMPAVFLANRSDLFAILFLTIAALAYFRVRRAPSVAWLVIGGLAFLAALLSKEPAVMLAGLFVVHAFATRREWVSEGSTAARYRFTGLIALVAAIYLFTYFRSSTNATQFAADRFSLDHLLNAGRSLLLYASVWGIGIPIALLAHAPAIYGRLVMSAGFVVSLAMIWVVRRQFVEKRPGVLFFTLWAVVFVAPALLTFPESRALSIATVGWAWLLAGILMPSEALGASQPSPWTRQWFLAANGITSVCCAIGMLFVMNRSEDTARDRLSSIAQSIEGGVRDGDTLLILKAESPYELICAGDRLSLVTGQRDVRVNYLTLAGANARIEREGPRSYLIRGDAPQLFDSPTHKQTLGENYEPCVGDRFDLADFVMQVAELNDEGHVIALRLQIRENAVRDRIKTFPPTLLSDELASSSRP